MRLSAERMVVLRASFLVALGAITWWSMMAIHEFGHVLHAWLSGGRVLFVDLPPLGISFTHIETNPHPAFVGWGGPIWGAILPFAFSCIVGPKLPRLGACWTQCFAGFCLIANGGYLLAGTPGRIGDLQSILDHGGFPAATIGVGALEILCGLWLWHRLGLGMGWNAVRDRVSVRVAFMAMAFASLVGAVMGLCLSPLRFQ